ncbi:CxxH/CxxC protein [Paenibacillus gansuensis]|uniref:CxxH/CxxC protein n=1 Tax=Paenibacillus gansuensis TaxID=306542 RepID=A0ABW5PKC7_9BACL
MYVVCKDHLELAIDKFVDEYEDAPDLVDLECTHFNHWDPPAHCEQCAQKGKFLVV